MEQIDVLAASSFPHDDGKAALAAIRRHFTALKRDLDVPATARDDVIDQLCLQLSDVVTDYTDILGFILRSTNVRNPFELHFVLKELIHRALGEGINLLISSEWAYVPFTYPMSVELLPEFVLIGTPAPESGNPLLIPLAGHEIGHSAWRVYDCPSAYGVVAARNVEEELAHNSRASRELFNQLPLNELEASVAIDRCAEHVMHQLEEIFCDLFGLFLFGHAYIAAFDYLLGPGGFGRTLDYPSDDQRIAILVDGAGELGIDVLPAMRERWIHGQPRRSERPMAEITDAVVARMVPAVRSELFDTLSGKGLAPPDPHVFERVLGAFRRGEPYCNRAELGEIISAGWIRILELDPEGDEGIRRRNYRVLSDLVLKSVEVAEFYDRIEARA